MSFLTTTKLVSKPIGFLTWPLYFFDLLAIGLALYIIHWVLPSLGQFSNGTGPVVVSGNDFMLVGGFGLYGFRIATYIAILRQRRMPQKAEWLVTLLGFAFMIGLYVFGGWMLKEYAALHGYQYCFTRSSRHPDWVFVQDHLPCPPAPSFQEILEN